MRTQRALGVVGALGTILGASIFVSGRFDRAPPPDIDTRAPRIRGESPPRSERIEPEALALPADADSITAALAELDEERTTLAVVRSTLEEAIEIHLPDLKLSSEEIRALADATLRLRNAQAALRELPKTVEHAGNRALERRRLEEAVDDFSYLMEMTPSEFSTRVAPQSGIDEWSPIETPGEIELRPIARGRPRERATDE